jgi:hypothetical protein
LIVNRKFNHLKKFLAQDKISILSMSETHTVKSIAGPKFHCYQRNSEINPTPSGGVAFLVAQNLASTPHTLPNHLNHLEAVAANLHLQNMSILIISYYNRPQDRVSADLLRYAAQHNFAIVLGDFNARHTDFLALIREKRRVYRSFIQTRDPALKTIFNRLNAQVRRDLNRFREEQWIDSCRLLDYRNGKKFWTQFQTLTGQKTTTVHHLVRNNAIINTPLEKANCFAETLEQIHQVPNDPHFDDAFFAQVIRSVNNFRTLHHQPHP